MPRDGRRCARENSDADETMAQQVAGGVVDTAKIMLGQLAQFAQGQAGSASITLPPDLVRSWKTAGRTNPRRGDRTAINDNDTLPLSPTRCWRRSRNAIGGPVSILKSGDTSSGRSFTPGCGRVLSISILLWIALAAGERRAADTGAASVAGALTLEICVLIGPAAQLRQHHCAAASARRGVAFKIYYVVAWRAGHTKPSAIEPDARDLLQRADHRHRLRQPVAVEPPRHRSMGKLLALLSRGDDVAAVLLFQPALMGRPRDIGK